MNCIALNPSIFTLFSSQLLLISSSEHHAVMHISNSVCYCFLRFFISHFQAGAHTLYHRCYLLLCKAQGHASDAVSGTGRRYYKQEPYKPVTMNDLPVPRGSWHQHYANKQKNYNLMLAGGAAFFGFTAFVVSVCPRLLQLRLECVSREWQISVEIC